MEGERSGTRGRAGGLCFFDDLNTTHFSFTLTGASGRGGEPFGRRREKGGWSI